MSVIVLSFPGKLSLTRIWKEWVQVRVVFILPTFTSSDTMATLMARSVSICNFSRTTREHLLLRAIESIYSSENVIFGEAASYDDVKTALSLWKIYSRSANWISFRNRGLPSGFLIWGVFANTYIELREHLTQGQVMEHTVYPTVPCRTLWIEKRL